MLRAQDRGEGLLELIDQKQYFVIHAARQSGKTTLLQELTDEINTRGTYYCSVNI